MDESNKKYYYIISAVVMVVVLAVGMFYAGPLVAPGGKFTGVTTLELQLVKGWNLVSVPYITFKKPVSTDCAISAIYHFNSDTRLYDAVDNLDNIEPGLGYWIRHDPSDASQIQCRITFLAEQNSPAVSTSNLGFNGVLKKGWNQIGATYESINLYENNGNCQIEALYGGFDSTNRQYIPTETIETGKSYWIRITNDNTCTLAPNIGGASGGEEPPPRGIEVTTIPGNENQVPQAVPSDSSIPPTPALPPLPPE